MELFFKQFDNHISFIYSLFDRLIFRGYIGGLFNEGSVINLLKNLGFHKRSNGVLRSLTDSLNSHIEKTAEKSGVDILWWNNLPGEDNQKKKDYLKNHYLNKKKPGVLCVVKRMENTKTAWFREITTKKRKKFNKLFFCNKLVKHYYIYIYDDVLGLCYLKIATYLPFYVEFYCNGHYYIQREFDKRGIKYKMNENSFIKVDNQELLKELSESFEGAVIEERIHFWWDKFFRFDKGQRSTRSSLLQHLWYTQQAEISTNVIFKTTKYFEGVYERFLQKHHRIGQPDVLKEIFEEKKIPAKTTTKQSLYELNANLRHWFGSNSVKMYNKGGYLLRVETTINKPDQLRFKLKKPVRFLRAYYWYGLGCNNRYLDMLSDIDPDLINPEITEKMNQTITTEKGRRIAAPDLRKEHELELCKTLLNARFVVQEFKTTDLKDCLSDNYAYTSKIRYQLQKYIARGLVKKTHNTNNYIVTREGYSWLYVSYCQISGFKNPLLSKVYKNSTKKTCKQPDKFEKAMSLINQGLDIVKEELNLAA